MVKKQSADVQSIFTRSTLFFLAAALAFAAFPSSARAIIYNTGDVANDANLEPPGFSNIEIVEFQDIGTNQRSFLQYVTGGSGKIKLYSAPTETAGGPAGGTAWLGIGKDPSTELDVAGTVKATGFAFPTGAGADKVLTTADANGGMFWSGLGTLLQALTGYSSTANQVLKNESGTIAWGNVDSVTESDPTVSAWAKAAMKPPYGFSEITGSVTDAQVPDNITITESDPVFSAQKGQPNGVATLGADSKVPSSQLPKLVITDVLVQPFSAVDTAEERATLEIEQGDVIIDVAANKTYIWSGTEWKEIIAPNTVTSVNGETGTVSLSLNDISDVDVTTCTLNHVLKWNGTGWSCAADSDSDVWTTLTGGIKYTGGNVGIGAGITDAEIISPLTVKGDVAAGSFTTAGTVDAGGIIARGGNIVAQSSFSSNWKYEPGNFIEGHSAPRCNTAGTGGKLNCDISSSSPDCGGQVYDIGTDPGTAPSTCYDWYVTAGGQDEQRAYNRVSSATTGGWVSGATGYSDSISIGGDSAGDDLEVKINAPVTRNKISFTNPSVPGGLADISAKKGFFESLFVAGGSADGQVLTYDAATQNAVWRNPGSGADNWGTQVVARDATLKGNGTSAAPLGLMACAANQGGYVLKWNSTTSTWGCASDTGGIAGSGTAGKIAKWTASGLGDSVITETTSGNVGIGTAAPTGILDINPLRSFSGQDLDSTNRTRITGFPSGHDVQIGDMIKITAGDNDWHVVVGRGSDYADISTSDLFDAVFSDAASYSLQKKVALGGGNTYAGTIDVNKVDTNTIQIRTGATAGKFLKSTDTSGNAVWDSVPPAYADANVEAWAESKMVDGDFSASPSTAKIRSSLLPALAITNTFPITVADSDTPAKCQTAVTGLTNANEGDVAICAGINKTYILTARDGRATFSNWSEIKAPNQVTSVNGQTGAVTINTDDADASPTNEAQTLTYTDSTRTVNLTAVGTTGGGSFILPQGSKWSDATGGINYASGNVGIGTANPGAKLDVKDGNVMVSGINNGGIAGTILAGTDASGHKRSWGSYYANNYGGVQGLQIWEYQDSVNGVACTGAEGTQCTPRFTLATGGNVGIGTASPGGKLEVSGFGRTVSSWNYRSVAEFNGGSASNNAIIFNTGAAPGTTALRGLAISSGSQDFSIARFDSAGEAPPTFDLTVNSAGNVGIGTAPIAGNILTALGDVGIGGTLSVSDTDNGTVKNGLHVDGTGDSYFMGNVGIGTNAPQTNLEIYDGTQRLTNGGIEIQNRYLAPGEAGRQWVYVGTKGGHHTTNLAIIDDVTGAVSYVSGGICTESPADTRDTGPKERARGATYPTSATSLTYCVEQWDENDGATDWTDIWATRSISNTIPTPSRAITFVDLQSPLESWGIRNVNGTLSFFNGASLSRLTLSQAGDLSIVGSISPIGGDLIVNGNVGIGTAPGAYKLNVNGNTNITGNVTTSGFIRPSGGYKTASGANGISGMFYTGRCTESGGSITTFVFENGIIVDASSVECGSNAD